MVRGGGQPTRHRSVLFVLVILMVVGLLGCTRAVSPNVVEVVNYTDETLTLHTVSGELEPRQIRSLHDAIYIVPLGGCMDDGLFAVDEQGDAIAEVDRPCGGEQWILGDPGLYGR